MDNSEAKIQQNCVQWYRNTFCLKHHSPRCMIFSVPNEGARGHSAKLIATGLYPGVSDLVVIHTISKFVDFKTQTILFIEVKTSEGVQSDKQKDFQGHCKTVSVPYHVVRSLDDFRAIIMAL